MGQKVGKAKFEPAAKPFLNANKACMEALWNNFNEIAEGFGLNSGEFQRICDVRGLKVTPEDSQKAFKAFDTDKNGLVDALEFLTTFAVTSGLDLNDKIRYTFRCYDFDESNELTTDEMTLSLKSTLTGLAKLSGEDPPDPLELEDIAQQAFDKADKNKDSKITFEEYQEFCVNNPEVQAWINYYDDPTEDLDDEVKGGDEEEDSELEAEGVIPDRDDKMEAARNPELGMEFAEEEEMEADQFMAVKPWVGVINNTVPTSHPPLDPSQPDTTLQLEWVHGYRAQDARNNLRYLASGEIVYSAAAAGIVYTQDSHSMRFCIDHTDDIICLAVHPEGRFVATGEMGRKPKICVWDADDKDGVMDSVKIIQGHARRAVIQLAFSPDGRKLAAIGEDDDHTIFVYDWQKEQKIYSEKSDKAKVLDLCWLNNDNLVSCGVKHIYFWDLKARNKKKGIWGRAKNVTMQALMSLAPINDGAMLISGTASGHLYAWDGRNCVRAVKAHDANVAALWACSAGLVSGGKDGKVRIWTHALEPRNVFDISTFGSVRPSIRSVHWDHTSGKLLVGTIGSEIYELNSTDGENLHHGPLISGHFKDELWGLAVHPRKQEYVTVGDDGTLRRWDVATRKILTVKDIGTMARAIAYSPDGSQLAIGLGGDVGRGRKNTKGKKDGGFMVLGDSDLKVLHQARDSRQWISDVKYSPDGKTLAIGSHDNKIYLYDVDTFHLKGTCAKHTSYITHFDFSSDSIFIQSNCGGYELLFYDANTGEQQTSAPAMKDVAWHTWTCVLGWPVQGIWPKEADGTDINAVCRSWGGDTLLTADDFGRVKLFRYPCVQKDSAYHEYVGHSSHVTNCRFTQGDRYAITTGGNDRTVFQWRVSGGVKDTAEEAKIALDSDDEAELRDGKEIERSAVQERVNTDAMDDVFAMEEDAGGDEFMAVKPWVGAIVEPTVPPKADPSVPDTELSLEWVHGYRAQDAKNNLYYNAAGEMVYTAAGLGITLNKEKWLQKFNQSHNDDVICLALHPDGIHVATGQMGKKPLVVVWRSDTMEAVSVIKGLHKRAVCAVAFSSDPKCPLLATVGQDDDHTVAVYDWKNRTLKAKAKGDKNKTLGVAMSPDGRTICQVGLKHIKFHHFNGRNMETKKGILGKKGKVQPLLCVEYLGASALVGTADGHLYRFGDRELAQAVKAHDGQVAALHITPSGVVTGGKDGRVKLWTPELAEIAEFDMTSVGALRPSVRSVCWDTANKKILVGTIASEIFEISATDGNNINEGPLVQGHFKDELWGLAMDPKNRQFVSCGDDNTLRVWDIETRKMIRQTDVGTMARACAFSPDGEQISVGLGGSVGRGKQPNAGKWLLLRARDLEQLNETKDASQWIGDVKYSPDGGTLGVASHDNKIYLYDVKSDYTLRGTFAKHTSYITHFDFSKDSQYIQSNCGGYELLFSDAKTAAHIPAASRLKDTEWASWTCVLGWPVQGIWPKFADGTDINAVDRSPDGSLLATADDFGLLKVFRYPCVQVGSAAKEYRGHSSHVTNVRWTPDGKHLITAGGNDRCIFQWQVEYDEVEGVSGAVGGPSAAELAEDLGAFGMAIEEDAGGDEFMAVKPWIGAIHAPTSPPAEDVAAPKINLELEWCYGYRSQDARGNLRYNDAGEIVYHSAAVGVIYDKAKHHQKFYQGHTDDIVCLAVDASGNFVCTGQQGRKPRIHVWDSESGALLTELPTFHRRAVTCLDFSPDGKQIVSVGDDDDHSVAAWKSPSGTWTDGELQNKSKGDRGKTLFALWCAGGDYACVTGGVKHIKFWRLDAKGFTSKKGIFGSKANTVVCAASVAGQTVTGAASGHMYVWAGNSIAKAISAHDASLNAIYAHPSGVVTGSKDGKVRLWSNALECTGDIDLGASTPVPFDKEVRSVALNHDGSLLLVGTKGSEIYEVTVASRKSILLHQAHCKDELWGLSTHPTAKHLCATAGDDKTVRVWNLAEHRMMAMAQLDAMTRAVSWSPDGTLLGCGLGGRVGRQKTGKSGKKDGGYVVLRADTMEVIHYGRDSKQWIQDVKFSPDGATFGVGSHDNKVYLYDARGGRFALKTTCAKHNSYITHFDFSVDSAVMQSNCGAYELLFFNANTGDQIPSSSSLRDTEWATWTCTLGWPVQGIWPAEADGTDINSVDRSHNGRLLATADDFGKVRVFNYPCVQQKPQPGSVDGLGHSSHVTNCRWTADDKYLITCGGNDRSVMQWRVSKK